MAAAGFTVAGDRLLYKVRMVLAKTSAFIPLLLREYHDSPTGGHSGEVKTYLRLVSEWFWQGMRKEVAKYVRGCVVCQRNKHSQQQPAGLLQPLPIPMAVWEDVSMDFTEGLLPSKGVDTILVVVDHLSKYAHFMGLKHPFTTLTVASLFIKEIVRLHGLPTSIISDRDRIFLSIFWRELFKLHGTDLKRSTAYHPQTDGQSKNVNKGLETYLRCFAGGKPKEWAKWLSWEKYSYNTSPHSSTSMTPFRVVYGRDPPTLLLIGEGQTPVDSTEEILQERDAVFDELKMNQNADNKRRKIVFR